MALDDPPPSDESAPPPADAEVVPAVPRAESLAAGDGHPEVADRRLERRTLAARRRLDKRVMAVVEGMSDAFLALDARWRVTYANREAARLDGAAPADLVGADHWERWPHTVGTEVERQYRRVAAARVPVQFEHHYTDNDVWHDIRAYPSDDGGLAIFYRDITAERQLEAERARQARDLADASEQAIAAETQFRLLVEHVHDYAVFVLDPDGIVTHWGEGATRIKGWTPQEAVGRHLRDMYPGRGPAEDGSAEDHLRHAALHGEYIGEGTRMRRGVEPFPARVVLTALRRGGQLVGYSKITQDLTGERARQHALEQAAAAAVAASTAKSQFLANTSHEIRTPLNAIIGYGELLEVELAGPLTEQQRQYVSRIQATSRHLLTLINDVLDLSKIEAGEMHAAREAGLASTVVASAVPLIEPQARSRGLSVVNACVGDTTSVYVGDPERVRQILVNLLSNAVRFTESGGRVTISCGTAAEPPRGWLAARDAHAGPWTFIRIEDTGSGIAPQQLEAIWRAFVQVDGGHTRRFGGSGLGLTISRHLARLMDGDITVRSRPGVGSSFVLWLPAAGAGSVAEPSPASRRDEDPQDTLVAAGPSGTPSLAYLADALLMETERIIAAYAARLRTDPQTPGARALGESELEDHAVTFVADMAQCLNLVADDGPEAADMLRDGSAIQRLIAGRHGAQRRRLGWTEAELRRDFEVLREELHAVVRRLARGGSEELDRALGITNHFLADAIEASVAGFRAQHDAGTP